MNSITHSTKFLHHVHMVIDYGDCVSLGRHQYLLTLVEMETRYVWTYGIRALSGSDVIQALQESRMDAYHLP